jgi:ABC-type nitrate/sulfonate/bicarbonate transport system ATPase subunit
VKPAVTVRDLAVTYGDDRRIFDGFALDVARGETLAVLGPSGCGKSTLLRAIGRLVSPTRGTIETDGEIGLVFQEPRLMPWLTVEKNVAFAARGDVERARVKDVVDLVGLTHAAHLLPKALSGGMAQRASLARSLVRSPKLLLLDEPLSALDALSRLDLQVAIARIIRETACTAVLVTHDVDEALFLADRIVVLAGAPASVSLTLEVPFSARHVRSADLTEQRNDLYRALGVEAAPAGAHETTTRRIRAL